MQPQSQRAALANQQAPISTVTSSEIIATIADRGMVASSNRLRNKNQEAIARNQLGLGGAQSLYSPVGSAAAIASAENVAPNYNHHLQMVPEEDQRTDQ